MPILDNFCAALNQAISDYENIAQPVPLYRQQEIQVLRNRIQQCLQNRTDAAEFREEMAEHIRTISAGWFAFITPFDSRLRKNLLSVLNQEQFSEKKLLSKERTEDRAFHRTEIERLEEQITTLTQALAAERAKDNVQRVNELTHTVSLQQQNIDLLIKRNEQLFQSLNNTVENYQALQTDYKDLKAKYDALLAERENTSSDQQHAGQHSNHSTFFN